MREIKFRFWDLIDCKMLDGEFQIQHSEGGCTYTNGFIHGDDAFMYGFGSRYLPMQYTGMKDRNGVEIYEGDVVKSDFYEPEYSEYAIIGYDCFEMAFVFNDDSGDLNGEQDAFKYGNLEVVGNVYESPKFMEKQQ